MDKKRIEEIREQAGERNGGYIFADYAHELLDALESAQTEIDRLREALRQIETKILDAQTTNTGTSYWCPLCKRAWGGNVSRHSDRCPFKILEDGDG